jgi:peroxiredoxin
MLKPVLTLVLSGVLLLGCHKATQPNAGSVAGFVAQPVAVPEQPVPTLAIGAPAPDFRLPATDGKFYQLSDFKSAKILVVVFTCNHCPTAQAYEERLVKVCADYQNKNVAFVAISPNSPLALLYEEEGYTDLNDDFEAMKIRAAHQKFNFPYLYDGDNEAVSIKYGPVATPHVFVFDQQRKLRYNGRFDGIEKPGKANAEDLRNALDALLDNRDIAQPVTKTFGCSTKWAWKNAYQEKTEKEWQSRPVTLVKLDKQGIKNVVNNRDSDKLRLINVWATWCGPCVLEYPDFLKLQRMYGARDFEFVSISADKPAKEANALRFLQEKHSGVKNYIFGEEDNYALIEAIDPAWNGALPYTVLVEPGGKVVWSHQGEVNMTALRKIIVEHPKMGRYF